jgi:hypothetical protein
MHGVNNQIIYRSESGEMRIHSEGTIQAAPGGDYGRVVNGGSVTDSLGRRIADTPTYIANRIYQGIDLTLRFAGEISHFNNDPWAWIQTRIRSGDYEGINVGDWIPFVSEGNNYQAEIAGINTYTEYGRNITGESANYQVPNHIDFITRDCNPTPFIMNRANYNNGTSVSPNPWTASELFARSNNLQMDVPSTDIANGLPLINVDFREIGIFNTLPITLQNVIVQKRQYVPRRYTANTLLHEDNGGDWNNVGYLWLPTEIEVYGCRHWSGVSSPNQGWSSSGSQQYPIFANNMKRIKHAGIGGARTNWFTSVPRGGNSASFVSVSTFGDASSNNASNIAIRIPLCFRIA